MFENKFFHISLNFSHTNEQTKSTISKTWTKLCPKIRFLIFSTYIPVVIAEVSKSELVMGSFRSNSFYDHEKQTLSKVCPRPNYLVL